jgi:hypothetical protein
MYIYIFNILLLFNDNKERKEICYSFIPSVYHIGLYISLTHYNSKVTQKVTLEMKLSCVTFKQLFSYIIILSYVFFDSRC